MPPKKNLIEFYDDGTLDLSLNGLQDVPVKDIVAIPKAVNLDLSCNAIVSLPKTFASSLTRLVKLDLSKNQLSSLPNNFGLLINLRHLELDNNKIETLPLSFGNLKALRWLDLKQNPLMPKLAQIAGHCLDAQQCQRAARNVVETYRAMQEQVDAEISRRKEEQSKLAEKNEDSKNEELQQPKKKKKKKGSGGASNNANTKHANRETHSAGEGESKHLLKDDNDDNLPSVPDKTAVKKPGLLRKVGRLIASVVKVIIMSVLVIALCSFLLSLFDENLYLTLQKKVNDAIQSKIPKQYLKHWDNGMLVARRTATSWSAQAVTISVDWFNRAQDYAAALSSDEVVQQYLESIQSGWHILWIWLSETYASLSTELPRYFTSVKNLFQSSTTPS